MVMRGTANLFGQYFEEHKHLEVGRANTHIARGRIPMSHVLIFHAAIVELLPLHPWMILEEGDRPCDPKSSPP
jgi:hypothetical protein